MRASELCAGAAKLGTTHGRDDLNETRKNDGQIHRSKESSGLEDVEGTSPFAARREMTSSENLWLRAFAAHGSTATPVSRALGTEASGGHCAWMIDEEPTGKTGNEPAPLLLAAVAIVPLLAVVGWLVLG
jgi:hypothetical protein